jgi:hypothetical protein
MPILAETSDSSSSVSGIARAGPVSGRSRPSRERNWKLMRSLRASAMNQIVGALRSRRTPRMTPGETYFLRYAAKSGYLLRRPSAWIAILRSTSVEPSARGVVRIESTEKSCAVTAVVRGKVVR